MERIVDEDWRSDTGADSRRVLLTLRRDGPLSADDLATTLGITRLAALRRLRALSRAGFVTRRSVRHGVGRPRHLYDASPMGRGTVPGEYETVAASLLDAARDVGGHVLLAKVFDARGRSLAAALRNRFDRTGLAAAPLVDQVRELAAAQAELGYASDCLVTDDQLRLREFNCPIFGLVDRSQSPCEAETAMFADVLHASVTRETHIAAGARCCTFRIDRRVWDSTQMSAVRVPVRPPASTGGWTAAQMRPEPKSEPPSADSSTPEARASGST